MKRILTLLLITFLWTQAFSQTAGTMLGVLTTNEGLPDNTVYYINKDKEGFMWFATDMGISKYDGYRFTNFQLAEHPIAIIRIIETPDGLLWLLGVDGSLICFNPKSEKTVSVSYERPVLPNLFFKKIEAVGNDRLCVLTQQGLIFFRIDKTPDDEMKIVLADVTEGAHCEDGAWTSMCKDDKGRLFAYSEAKHQIFRYNPESDSSMMYNLDDVFRTIGAQSIANICVKDDVAWLYNRWHGMICYNLKNKEYREINMPTMVDVRGEVVSLGGNDYCLPTWNGLLRISFKETPVKGEYKISRFSNVLDSKTENKSLFAYFDEKEELLWVGTFGGGVTKFMPDNVFFRWINTFEYVEVNNIVEDNEGYIWLATVGKGVMKSNASSVSPNMNFHSWNPSVFSGIKYTLYKDRNGVLWTGDEKGNCYSIHPQTNEYTKHIIKWNKDNVLTSRIYAFCMTDDTNLWIATREGIMLHDLQTGNSKLMEIKGVDSNNKISLACGKSGDVWIGTQNGLIRGVKEAGGAYSFTMGYEEKAGLKPSLVYAVDVTPDNTVIASYADKVIFIDKDRKPEKAFSLRHGLPGAQIYCVTADLMGNFWLGGNSGIMTMREGTDLIYNYSFGGNNTAVRCLSDGRLLWSNSDGLFYYNPKKIKQSLGGHRLVLSKLVVDNQEMKVNEEYNGQVLLPQTISSLKELTFNDNNKNFTLFLTDLQYKTVSNKILYRLLPLDEEWNDLDVRDGINLSGLQAGEYTLQMRVVSYDGRMGEIDHLVIHILPHWAMSMGAWILYIVGLIALSYGGYRFIQYKISLAEKRNIEQERIRNELKLAELKSKREKEAVEVKNKFLQLLTNEFRTPLFMIINPLREILNLRELAKPLQHKAEIAYYNSIGLNDICTLLMDTYRLESEHDYLQVTQCNVTDIINDVISKQKEVLNVYQIEFIYHKPESGEWDIWVDRDKIEFVIRNLLSNAYRHVHYTGKVNLSISKQQIEGEEFCVLSVSDNGRNKVEENIDDILSSVTAMKYSVDFSRLELGIGLLKRIIMQHHGKVMFRSEKDTETGIHIYLKCGVEHLKDNSHVVFVQNTVDKQIDDTTLLPQTTWNMDDDAEDNNQSNKKNKLLIIDDNQTLRIYLKALFSTDYDVLEAADGQEGIDMTLETLPDVVLCDVMMPVKNGFEYCKTIKEDIRTCHIPVLFLTARDMDEDIMLGINVGADDYLQKPISAGILKAKVANIIKNRENLKQAYMNRLIVPAQSDGMEAAFEDDFLKQVIGIIEEHMLEVDFGVISLAKLLNMSQPTLYRKVKQCTDFNIAELIRGVRLRKAVELLKNEDYSIQEVVEKVGYNDSATFRKHFAKLFGTTPSAYVKKNKLNG